MRLRTRQSQTLRLWPVEFAPVSEPPPHRGRRGRRSEAEIDGDAGNLAGIPEAVADALAAEVGWVAGLHRHVPQIEMQELELQARARRDAVLDAAADGVAEPRAAL